MSATRPPRQPRPRPRQAGPRATTPGATTTTRPTTAAPPASAPAATCQQVVPGVYAYATTGFEETDALGGARHDYPAETTITVSTRECGRSVVWRPLAERTDERLICPGPKGGEVRRFASAHEFFGQTDQRTLTCPEGSLALPDDPTPGARFSLRCRDERTDAQSEGSVVGNEPVDVGGSVVQARRLKVETKVTGDSQATSIVELWLRPSDGLILRQRSQIDGTTSGPGGPIRYTERVDLRLRSIEPAR